jgi:hypothetical protein
MATGWAGDNAVNEQIEATIGDAVARARAALPGVRLCVACQSERDASAAAISGYNRRGSKDSQLR